MKAIVIESPEQVRLVEAAPGNPEVVDGYFALPLAPGLDLKLNEEVIRQHPSKRFSSACSPRIGTGARRLSSLPQAMTPEVKRIAV